MRSNLLLLLPLLSAVPAGATPLVAHYEVHAGGMTILDMQARFELDPGGYRVETRFRTRGVVGTMVPGEQVSRVAGTWAGMAAAPRSYISEGTWRGSLRRIALDWTGGEARVLDLTPPETEEREPVSPAQRRGTVDVLSAVAALMRTVERTGACDGSAAVFDGRRRSEYAARTERRELIRPWRGAWSGEALRCGFEGRLVAGFRLDQDRAEAARPQTGTAWIAPPSPGAPPIPVRIEVPNRWANATAVLLRVEGLPAQPAQQVR